MIKLNTLAIALFMCMLLLSRCAKDEFKDDAIDAEYYANGTFGSTPFFIECSPPKRKLYGYDFKKRVLKSDCLFRVNSGLGRNYGLGAAADKQGYALDEPYLEIRLLNLKTSDNACQVDEDAFLHLLRPRVFSFYNSENYDAPDLADIILRDDKGTYWRLSRNQSTTAKFEILKTKQADVMLNFVEIIAAKSKCKLIAKMTDGTKTIDVNLDFVWRFSRIL
jgi:hypothetical protein